MEQVLFEVLLKKLSMSLTSFQQLHHHLTLLTREMV